MPQTVISFLSTIWNWFISILPEEIRDYVASIGTMPIAD